MPPNNQSKTPRRIWRQIIAGTALIGVILGGAYLIQRPLLLVDLVNSHRFELDADMQELANQISLSDSATSLFRASRPQLLSAEQFNQKCHNTEATVAILGCYSDRQIFVYQVDHADLAGVMETTTAHEFLHAAYDRLTPTEKKQVNQWLKADYQRLRTDKLDQRMDFYDRTEPGQFENELHSILGTEFADLSSDLENYYRRYFNDRQAITVFYQQYSSKFLALEEEAKHLLAEIEALEVEISNDKADYEQQAKSLNQTIAAFNQRANSGDFISQSEFWQARRAILSEIDRLDVLRLAINSAVDEYNQMIMAYNDNIAKTETLNRSLNSLTSAPTLE